MSKLNIDGSSDPFYRYKMQKVDTVQEKGSTILVNIIPIAKDLNRPVEDLLKFLKGKLNTSITDKHDKIKIKGIVNAEKIQELIYEFINKFVLCKMCDNPETTMTNDKLKCGACGNKTEIN
jgi:translation initiation factor 5